MIDIGPFRLVNPPDGQESIIRAAIEAIDFPWERFAVSLAKDPDEAILVEWDDTGQSVSGLAHGYSLSIKLSTKNYHLGPEVGFVFAHEVGHLVDAATLRDQDRRAIMDLTISDPKTHRFDGQVMNGEEHPWSHNQPHDDNDWENFRDDYLFRHIEAFADLFVEAFAPKIWDGSFYPNAPVRGVDWLRFVHTTDNLATVRELVLWKPSPITPTSNPEPKEKTLSRDMHIDHALADLNRWLKNHPKKTPKRVKVLGARAFLRAIKPR